VDIKDSVAGENPVKYREIDVLYDNGQTVSQVGKLATSGVKTVFEYDDLWVKRGIELSPFELPTEKRSFQLDPRRMMASTFGLFADSLPDGWGLLIMDRWFKKHGIEKKDVTPIDRLAFLGSYAMGALCYRPPIQDESSYSVEAISVGEMAREAYELYEGRIEEAGRLLAQIGGSPGGARPKALIGVSNDFRRFVSGTSCLPEGFSQWFVKFSGIDNRYDGVLEFIYIQMAKNAGISVPDHMLITDDCGVQHIATRRFDRLPGNRRRHIATAGGLLHADHMAPTLDYEVLMKVAWRLTNSAAQAEEQFRRAAFNMFAINRDDHSKNHGYVMSEEGKWELSPAYDLTFSTGPNGEHWTSYSGEGRTPKIANLLKVAHVASIGEKTALSITDQVKTSVATFNQLAKENDIPVKTSSPIVKQLEAMLVLAN
jgi:serine/threonine-protein kinase HipA